MYDGYFHLGAQILWPVFRDGNDLLGINTDILIWDLGNAIFGKSLKESLEGCNNSVTDGEHFIKCNLDVSHSCS